MPAIASLEDLKAAQKDLQEAKDLNELKAAFKKWRKIRWKNMCGAPRTNVAVYLSFVWGDIPIKAWWPSAIGVSCGYRSARQRN